jgi:hypothetical protein
VLASVRAIHETQLENGDNAPLWLDEFGWSSCWPAHKIQQEQACVTASLQAKNLSETFRALARTPYVRAILAYKLKSAQTEDFGAVSDTGARKPAFAVLSSAFVSTSTRTRAVTVTLHARRGQVIASGSGPVGDYMNMEVRVHGTLRYRAIFTLDRFNRYLITLPKVLGTNGLSVRAYQYWQGSSRGAKRSI